jgi:hypothetical protein
MSKRGQRRINDGNDGNYNRAKSIHRECMIEMMETTIGLNPFPRVYDSPLARNRVV